MELNDIDFRGQKVDIEPPMIGVGTHMKIRDEIYVLCQLGSHEISFFNIQTGIPWDQPMEVEDVDYLSETEFIELMGTENIPRSNIVDITVDIDE